MCWSVGYTLLTTGGCARILGSTRSCPRLKDNFPYGEAQTGPTEDWFRPGRLVRPAREEIRKSRRNRGNPPRRLPRKLRNEQLPARPYVHTVHGSPYSRGAVQFPGVRDLRELCFCDAEPANLVLQCRTFESKPFGGSARARNSSGRSS